MRHWKKGAAILLLLVCCAAAGVFSIRYFSESSRNTRALEAVLSDPGRTQPGSVAELFSIDYDTLYVFAPYETKSQMEAQIGFSSNLLQESVSEECLNYLFVKDRKPAGYLCGLPSSTGYCINLQPGSYDRQELDQMRYEVETRKAGTRFGKEKTYQDYNFYYQDEIVSDSEIVPAQSGSVVTRVPVGQEISVSLEGSGLNTVRYCLEPSGEGGGNRIREFSIDGTDFADTLAALDVSFEDPAADYFYIVDLDVGDDYKEIALVDQKEEGAVTYFFRYRNKRPRLAGSISDMPLSETCRFESGEDGQGGRVIARFRLSLFENWYAEGYWQFDSAGKLKFVPQEVYYPTENYHTRLLCALPVYASPDQESERTFLSPGEVDLTATDDAHWVQVETKEDKTGWCYIEDDGTVAGTGKKTDEVFALPEP